MLHKIIAPATLSLVLVLADFVTVRDISIGMPLTWNLLRCSRTVDILPYDSVKLALLPPTNAFHAECSRNGDSAYIVVPGFQRVEIGSLRAVLNSDTLGPSLRLALYCMSYGYSLLSQYDRTRDPRDLNALLNVVQVVLAKLNEFTFKVDRLKYGDHAVSERMEFLLLLNSKLHERDLHLKLEASLDKEITHDIQLLLDADFFTWGTNHGLMEIRALAHCSEIISDPKLKERCLDAAIRRTEKVLPYFLAPDGSILESSSGYWLFIFEQLRQIESALEGASSRQMGIDSLNARINASRRFLRSVITDDGYLQGLGDSYTQHVKDTLVPADLSDRAFSFENGLAGVSYYSKGLAFGVLFVSLWTPPNVHKLPEDLATYIYVGGPIFVNTGTYSYDEKSRFRRYLESEQAQPTISLAGPVAGLRTDSSEITAFSYDSSKNVVIMKGTKWAGGIPIYRKLTLRCNAGILEISDSCSQKIVAKYIIDPAVKLSLSGADSLIFHTATTTVKGSYFGSAYMDSTIVSDKPESVIRLERLNIVGESARLKLQIPSATGRLSVQGNWEGRYEGRSRSALSLMRDYNKSASIGFSLKNKFLLSIYAGISIVTLAFQLRNMKRRAIMVWIAPLIIMADLLLRLLIGL